MNKKYHVKHILVKSNYEAEDLLRKIKDGKKFEDLAQKFSICPSSANGGDLGEIFYGKADEDFEFEVKRLAPQEISKKPVRTKFGYHLIYKIR